MREVAVDFAAADGGTGPLTWGQRAIWKSIRWYGEHDPYFNVHRVVTLPPGVTVPALVGVLRAVVEEQQSLRNRFAIGGGGLVQSVRREGSVPLGLSGRPAGEVRDRLLGTRFAITRGWPYALAAVVAEETVESLVIVASHLCLDGWAVEALARRVLAHLTDPAHGATGGAGGADRADADRAGADGEVGTLAQAGFEASARGRKRSATAVEVWADKLATVPDPPRPRPPRPPEPDRWHRADLDSAAVAAAVTAISARTRVSTSTVLLAATGVLLAALEGTGTWALQLIAANRYEPRRRAVLDAAAQNALLVLTPAATDWDGLVREVYRHATSAYSRAQYEPADLDRAIAPLAARPGVANALTSYFNDTRSHQDSWPDLAGAADPGEPVPSGTFPLQDCRFFLHVHATAQSCRLRLLADTAMLAPAEMLRALRGMQSVLVAAAGRRDLPLTELPALLDVEGMRA